MKNPRVARRYASALMSVAVDHKAVDATADDLVLIRTALADSRELRMLLASPIIQEAKKARVLQAVFEKRIGKLTLLFLDLLVRKQREVFLDDMIHRFLDLRDEMRGLVTVDVTAAVDLDAKQTKALTKELERTTGKSVELRLTRDASIMGGLVVRIGDTVHDASVRRQLARLRAMFAGEASATTH